MYQILAKSNNLGLSYSDALALLGRGHVPPNDAIGATEFHRFFDAKVAGVRSSTADAPPPSFEDLPPGCSLFNFRLLTIDEVTAYVRALPDKQSASDPMPTHLLNGMMLAPFFVELMNQSLSPTCFRLRSRELTSRHC